MADGFDPDAYLSKQGDFDPDAYLSKAAPAAPTNGGLAKNFGAGFAEGITGLPGMVVNAVNPVPGIKRVVKAVKGEPYAPEQQMEDMTAPGNAVTHVLNKGLGLIGLNPEDVTSDTGADRVARFAGMGATALLAPERALPEIAEGLPLATKVAKSAANSPIATATRKAATGVSSGLGGGLAEEATPDDSPVLKTALGVLGSIAGGGAAELPGLSRGVMSGVGKWAKPLTTKGQTQIAADTIRGRAANPEALGLLDNGAHEIVPGSKPTTFQQTGDVGLGGLEREVATKNPVAFNQRRADQNQARMSAMNSIQQDADPNAVGDFLRGQFRNFDDQTQQHIDALTAHAQQQTEALGGHGVPEQHGAAIRTALQDAENTARARERSLWKAVDPNNDIRVDASPTFQAARDIEKGMSRFAAPLEGDEKGIFESIAGNKDLSLGELSDLRSRVSTAARKELITSGNSPSYARMIRLRGAIQNNLANAAAGKAAQDAEAVASGAMAQNQSITGKIQGWVDDFYGNRAAQSGAASGEGAVEGPGMGAPSATSAHGTGFPPKGGLASPEGAESLPQQFDEDAAKRLTDATQATKDRAGTFGQGPAKQVLAKAGTQDVYRLPEAKVPEKYFHAGPTSFQDIQGLRQSVGDAAALPILRDYAAASLRKATEGADGTLDPRKVTAWQTKYGNALRAFPDLEDQFSTASRATGAIADAAAAQREAVSARNASALGKVAGAADADAVTKTVSGILGGTNAARDMRALVAGTASNAEARQGLRQAVANDLAGRVVSNAEGLASDGTPTAFLKPDVFQNYIKKNRAALSQVYSPEEMAILDRITSDLKRANQSLTVGKLPGGSNTAQDLHAIIANNPNATVLDRAVSEMVATGAGAALGHAPGAGLGWMGAKVANAFRAAGYKKVDELIADAMLNPELARDLLRKAPAQMDSGQATALAARIRRLAAGTLATQAASQSKPKTYAKGGRTHLSSGGTPTGDEDWPKTIKRVAPPSGGGFVDGLKDGFTYPIRLATGTVRRGTGRP